MPSSALPINIWHCLCLLVVFVTLGGCESATSSQEIVLPDTIHSDDELWRLEERSADEDQRVLAYFRKNPDLVDHPGFAGEEVCYTDGHGNHRYYWVSPVGDSRQWILLEYSGSRAGDLVEGKGAPFL